MMSKCTLLVLLLACVVASKAKLVGFTDALARLEHGSVAIRKQQDANVFAIDLTSVPLGGKQVIDLNEACK